MTTDIIRIFAVDDSETFLRGIESILALEEDLMLIGKAHFGQEAARQIAMLRPDVILMDLRLRWNASTDFPSQADGIQTLSETIRRWPKARIIVISSFSERRWVVQAVDAGAQGYLPKELSAEQMIIAIRAVARGDVALSAEQLRWLRDSVDPLTRREKEVLALLAEGKSDAEIASQLGIATRTASKHVENLRDKLEARSRWEAVIEARRRGLIA